MPDHAEAIYLFGRSTGAAAAAGESESKEEKLFNRACAGDSDAFNEIYRLYAPMVHGILLSRVSYDDVQDLTQEVFLLAHRRLETIRDPRALGGWLAQIARNRAVEHYRTSKPANELPDEVRARDEKKVEAAEALTAIRSLPDAYRETLILRLVEGMSGNEIADRTGLTPESVRVNLHRGMEMLRGRLGINGAGR